MIPPSSDQSALQCVIRLVLEPANATISTVHGSHANAYRLFRVFALIRQGEEPLASFPSGMELALAKFLASARIGGVNSWSVTS
jgi:hypothetical protein